MNGEADSGMGRWIVIGAVSAKTREAGRVSTRGRVAIVDDQLLIEDMDVKGRGTARVSGALALHDEASNDLSASWRDARWINDDVLTWLTSPLMPNSGSRRPCADTCVAPDWACSIFRNTSRSSVRPETCSASG